MSEVVASLEAVSGTVTVERDGESLIIRQGRARTRLTEAEAKNLVLAVITPAPEWRRAMLWAVFDRQLEDIWASSVEDDPKYRGDLVLALQRMVGAMKEFGVLGGGDDQSLVAKVLAMLAGDNELPDGFPELPGYDEDEEAG